MQVIDTAIFIQGMDVEGVTTPKVVEEVKDPESRLFLEGLISAGKVKVLVPSRESVEAVKEAARKTGDEHSQNPRDSLQNAQAWN